MSVVLRAGEFTVGDIRAAQAAGKKVVCVSPAGESNEVRHEFVSFAGEYPDTGPSFYVHSRRERTGIL
jgi:hypothetical protein